MDRNMNAAAAGLPIILSHVRAPGLALELRAYHMAMCGRPRWKRCERRKKTFICITEQLAAAPEFSPRALYPNNYAIAPNHVGPIGK